MREATDPQFARLVPAMIALSEHEYRGLVMRAAWAFRYDRPLPSFIWSHVAVIPNLPEWHAIRNHVLPARHIRKVADEAARLDAVKHRKREYMRTYMQRRRAKA